MQSELLKDVRGENGVEEPCNYGESLIENDCHISQGKWIISKIVVGYYTFEFNVYIILYIACPTQNNKKKIILWFLQVHHIWWYVM